MGRQQFLFLFLSLPAAACLATLHLGTGLESPPHYTAWWDRVEQDHCRLQGQGPAGIAVPPPSSPSSLDLSPGLAPVPHAAHCTLPTRCTLHNTHYTLYRASTSTSTSQRGARRCSSGPRHRAPLLYGPGCVVRYSVRYSVQYSVRYSVPYSVQCGDPARCAGRRQCCSVRPCSRVSCSQQRDL